MPATWEIIITGCGTSHGNPPWGYPEHWSDDPRDQRRRSGAVLLGPGHEVLLIDAGPDLMHQLRDPERRWDGRGYPAGSVTRCDGVLLTHAHADHSHGLNDLRHLNRLTGAPIPLYGADVHLAEVQGMFPYCFARGVAPVPGEPAQPAYGAWAPALIARHLVDGVVHPIAGLPVTLLPMSHGPAGRTTAFRCGGLGYLTDLKSIDPVHDHALAGLDLLVLDMLREQPHETHLCWAEAQALIARLRPRRTVLTHMGHEVRYADWQPRLPADVVMAIDGLRLPFSAG